MTIYQATKTQFLHHALREDIEDIVSRNFRRITGHGAGPSKMRAWKHSLLEMAKVMQDGARPDDAGVAIEYQLLQTANRRLPITGDDDLCVASFRRLAHLVWRINRSRCPPAQRN